MIFVCVTPGYMSEASVHNPDRGRLVSRVAGFVCDTHRDFEQPPCFMLARMGKNKFVAKSPDETMETLPKVASARELAWDTIASQS